MEYFNVFSEELQKKDAELERKISELGLEGLKKFNNIQECSRTLQEWGIKEGEINKGNILAASAKFYQSDCDNFTKCSTFKNQNTILDSKITQVQRLTEAVDSSRSVLKDTVNQQTRNMLNKDFLRNTTIQRNIPDKSEDVLPHELLDAILERVNNTREELRKLQEVREKFPLPPDRNAAKEQLNLVMQELRKKRAMVDESMLIEKKIESLYNF